MPAYEPVGVQVFIDAVKDIPADLKFLWDMERNIGMRSGIINKISGEK